MDILCWLICCSATEITGILPSKFRADFGQDFAKSFPYKVRMVISLYNKSHIVVQGYCWEEAGSSGNSLLKSEKGQMLCQRLFCSHLNKSQWPSSTLSEIIWELIYIPVLKHWSLRTKVKVGVWCLNATSLFCYEIKNIEWKKNVVTRAKSGMKMTPVLDLSNPYSLIS